MQGPELSRAFMLRYRLYRHYFPLMAIGRALARAAEAPPRVSANALADVRRQSRNVSL
jgi:squalene-hopene/tetraprenyl-beta-curcumene cyclase